MARSDLSANGDDGVSMNLDIFLKILLSVIGFLLVYVLQDIKTFLKETRNKLDTHCENYELHHHIRRSTDHPCPD